MSEARAEPRVLAKAAQSAWRRCETTGARVELLVGQGPPYSGFGFGFGFGSGVRFRFRFGFGFGFGQVGAERSEAQSCRGRSTGHPFCLIAKKCLAKPQPTPMPAWAVAVRLAQAARASWRST